LTEAGAVRAFLAVPADPAWVESALEFVGDLRSERPEASWTRPESWHLTLHFLGEVSRADADRFAADIAPHARETPEGGLEASGAVIFPPRGPARVLAVGFKETVVTASLARLAAEAAQRDAEIRNPKSEIRNRFHPHITFARLRRPWPREAVERYRAALDAWRPPPFRARSCVLFQSRLDPAGAMHTPLASFGFARSPVEARA
jgi:2'-5' RNA ligase